ncbi:hypothetical protein EUGRSUZ_F03975 [Eucalyptus grandis]|uniref:Uncharacterized protein n=2 Tax=Eucalyptus grandis TaxID=71139 RepID=A0ACC3KN96_EUCGR|nr:hypothetical protein EUGRSUZ_F03975 [Eucalyptus grandis]
MVGLLHAVAGNSAGIKIHAVFVSKVLGELLQNYADSAWSIMAISFISLLAMSAVLATCFFVRRHRIRREGPRAPRVREFHGMSSRLVKAMPKFHALCADSWLTSWRTFCPVCKRDARTCTGEPPASESTPLLSSSPASVASSSALSSARSSVASSSAIQIARASRPPSESCTPSLSSTCMQQSFSSYRQSPPLSISRSSADLRNASSHRFQGSYLVSPHSMGYPSISPVNSRYISRYIPSPSNTSPASRATPQ